MIDLINTIKSNDIFPEMIMIALGLILATVSFILIIIAVVKCKWENLSFLFAIVFVASVLLVFTGIAIMNDKSLNKQPKARWEIIRDSDMFPEDDSIEDTWLNLN